MLVKKSNKNETLIYGTILFFFSTIYNQHFGNIGIFPIDSFAIFNSGYDIINGYFPFKDYWTITGPFIDLTQSFLFKIFGLSWFTYVLHGSLFNFLISITTFLVLKKFNLNINYCFLYAFLTSMLAYPSAGTPYVDQHSAILSIICIYVFILGVKTDFKIYWFLLPIVLGISFLSKQTPTGYIFIIICILSLLYFIFYFNLANLLTSIIIGLSFILLFFLILKLNNILLSSFIEQYLLYPLSIGKSRMENFLFPLEFKRIVLRHKWIHLSILILIVVLFKNLITNINYIKKKEFIILAALIPTNYALIAHQLMTINGLFIFFLIPIMGGFSHVYWDKYYSNRKKSLILMISLIVITSFYYQYKYIFSRNFLGLTHNDIQNSVSAEIFDKKLKGLKWITYLHPSNPNDEINKLKNAINIIKEDTRKKSIISDYQFISVILNIYDFAPSKYWYHYHVYPSKNQKFFKVYRNFFISKLKENNIQVIYTVKPLVGDTDVIKPILNISCYKKEILTDILDRHILKKCDDLKK